MIFAYHDDASKGQIKIKGELFKHLIKARRSGVNDEIVLKNLSDDFTLYTYEISSLEPREALLSLKSSIVQEKPQTKSLHIGWCMIDPKNIENTLASLNELGVSKITFISCDRTQKSFKINEERLHKILINSNQQCGRYDFMKFDYATSLESFVTSHPDAVAFDFSEETCEEFSKIDTFIIGCEGGFSERERNILKQIKTYKLKLYTVMRSQSAALAISAKILI